MNPEQLLNEFISRNQNIDREKASRIINEQFLSLFPPHILEYCANYEIIQEKLLSLTNTQLNIISKIIASAEAAGQDWTIPAAEYITLVENPAYRELTGSLEGKLLTEKEISSLMFLTRNSFNYYGIRDYEGLTNIEDIRQTQYEKTKTSISPEIILLNKYGISFNTANNYIKRYGKDIKLLPRCAEREILEDIDHILKNEGTFEPISYDYDLINNLIKDIKNDPYGRRKVVSLWQEADLRETPGLAPCAFQTIWNVRNDTDGAEYLDMVLIQRSGDMLTASGPGGINEIQYAALLMMIARHTGYMPGKFSHFVANEQIYDRHFEAAAELIKRYEECYRRFLKEEYERPQLILNPDKNNFYDFTIEDFQMVNYKPTKPQLKLELGI